MSPKRTKKAKAVAVVTPKSGKAKKAPAPQPESDEEDSGSSEEESEEEAVPVKQNKKSPKAVAPIQKSKKQKGAAKVVPKPVANSEDDDDDSEEDDSEEDEEETAAVKNGKAAVAMEEDSDDDEEEDSDEEEAPKKVVKAKNGKAAAAAPAESDDDDSEDDDEEESNDDDEEEEVSDGKRKKAQKDKASKKAKVEEVVTMFIANLDNETSEKKIAKLFSKHDIEVSEIRKPPNKGFAYVDLANASDVEKALELTGEKIKDQEIRVEKAKAKKGDVKQVAQLNTSRADEDSRTLFVKNLAESVTEEMLRESFDNLETVRMPQKPDGMHKGFAYMVFNTVEESATALEDMQGADLEGQSLFLDRPRAKEPRNSFGGNRGGAGAGGGGDDRRKSTGERGSSKVLFVRNLPFSIDEDGLRDSFDNATSARIVTHQDTGKPRGFGFVEFSSPDDAASAHDKMQGQDIEGRSVFVDFAANKGEGGNRSFGGRGGGGRGGGGYGGGGGGGGYGGGRGGGGRGGGFRGGRGGRGGGGRGGGGFQGQHKKF